MRHSLGRHFAAADPVFVDRSGRRRRLVRRIGIGVSLLAVAYGAVLIPLTLFGVHVDAPGLPLFEHLTQTMSEQPAHLHAKSAGSSRAPTSPTPTARPTRFDVDAPTSRPESKPETKAAESDAPTPGVAPSSTASPSAAASSSGKSVDAPGEDERSTHVNQGQSDAAPGAAERSTHVNQGKSDAAPGASQRSTHVNKGKSDAAPGTPHQSNQQ